MVLPLGKAGEAMDEITQLIERVVRERLKEVTIDNVTVSKEVDYEDGQVFRVTIVFDQKSPLDPRKTVGLVRHLRHQLRERHEETFPILAFVSKSDAARMGTEAA
jgi:hypothetical protein